MSLPTPKMPLPGYRLIADNAGSYIDDVNNIRLSDKFVLTRNTADPSAAIDLNSSGIIPGRLGSEVMIDYQDINGTTYTTPTWAAGKYRKIRFDIEATAAGFSYWKYLVNGDTGTNYNETLANANGPLTTAVFTDPAYGVNAFGRFGVIGNSNPSHNVAKFEFFPLTTGRRRFGLSSTYGEGGGTNESYCTNGGVQWKDTTSDVVNMTIFSDTALTGSIAVWGVIA